MSILGDGWNSFKSWWGGEGKDYSKQAPMPDMGFMDQANARYDRFANKDTPNLGTASLAGGGYPFRQRQLSLSDMLARRARGRGLVSSIQANQAAQQAIQGQQAMAASAAPGQGAAAQRMMMQNAGNTMSALAGQRALAGAQESQMAAQNLGGVLQGARGLDINNNQFNAQTMNQRDMDQAQLEMMRRQQLLQSLGQQGGFNMAGAGLQSQHGLGLAGINAGANMNTTSGWDKAMQLGGTAAGVGFLLSDRRKKTAVKDGGEEADEFLDNLLAKRYRYKDQKDGKGAKLGIMAQDLERSKAGKRSVVETPKGKMVDLHSMVPTLAASLARVNQRLRKVEAAR